MFALCICQASNFVGDKITKEGLLACIFQYISNKMQRYRVYLYLETTLHVSGGTSNHHQERIQLYLQHLVFVTHDDGWRYHSKHVEQFPDINKLCNVASCGIYIKIYLRCTDP